MLNTIGALGVDSGDLAGLDIASGDGQVLSRILSGGGDVALAALQRPGGSRLYSIDLLSGRARDRGVIGDNEAVRDIAIAPMDSWAAR